MQGLRLRFEFQTFFGGMCVFVENMVKFILLYLLERYDKIREEKEQNMGKGAVELFIQTIHD